MTYTPTQPQGNLDADGLRRWTVEEFIRLARAYQEDTVPFDATAIQGDITALQTDVGTLQTDVTALQASDVAILAKLAQADDYVSFSGGPTGLTTATPLTIASGSIPIGTWDIYASVLFTAGGGTTSNDYQVTIGTAANTVNSNLPESWFERRAATADWNQTVHVGPLRVVLGSATTYRVSTRAIITAGTLTATAFLEARRIIV